MIGASAANNGDAVSCARVSGESNSMAMKHLIGMGSSLDARRLFSVDE
jgi:hypothetical protein